MRRFLSPLRSSRMIFRLALPLLGLAAVTARGQEPGVRHIVINELAPANQADHAIELYNYGPDQAMNGWVLQYKTLATGAVVTYVFPGAFVLPRHAVVTVHYASGTNTTTDLFSGSPELFSNSGGEVLLRDGPNNKDFMKFGGAVAPSIQPADLPWTGPSVNWPTAPQGLARGYDPNTRSANDWYQPGPPTDGPTLGFINMKQTGTRLYAPLLINEFNRTAPGTVEIYNPNPFPVNANGMQIRGGQTAVDTQCTLANLAVTIPAGGFQQQAMTCGQWATNNNPGSIRLQDPAGNVLDSISFNLVAGDLTMATTAINRGYRKSDIPTASLSDWVTVAGAFNLGLNPGQQGALRYDELGTSVTPLPLAANNGAGMQMDLTRAVTFREVRVRMSTTAANAEIALYRLTGAPNSWTRVAGPFALTVVNGVEQVYTTGPINVNFNSPGTIMATVFANGPFTLQQTPPAERFSYGFATGINGFNGYPSPAGPAASVGLNTTTAVQFYFWTQPAPAVQPETLTLKSGEMNCAGYSQQFTSSTGTAPISWSSTALPSGLLFNSGTQVISGTPTVSGTFNNIQVTANDSLGINDTNSYTLDIYNTLQWVTLCPLPDGEVGLAYNQVLSASGGPPASYNWSVAPGPPLPGGLTLGGATGQITGAPTTAGANQAFNLRVTDGLGCFKDIACTQTIQPMLTITSAALPSADTGGAYSALLTFTGGAPGPLTWSVISGSLPATVTLAPATGQLSGSVSAPPGPYNFTAQAVDSLGGTATKPLSIQVNPALNMVTASLPDGEEHRAYNQTFTASGGNGTYNWSALSGLPGFCNLSTGGILNCADPTPPGPVALTVRLTDTAGGQVDRLFNFQFVASPLITTASLSDGEVNAPYSVTMAASGGIPPYSWNGFSLPPGLTLNAAGVITGSPTGFGTFNGINISLTDGLGGNAAKIFNNVVIHPQLQITTLSLPGGDSGGVYSSTLNSAGGDPGGRSWTVISGGLPAGLALDGPTGVLSGTISALPGPYSFTVRVADSFGNASRLFSLQVYPALANNTAALPDGEAGIGYSQTLNAGGGNGPYTWSALSGLPAFCSFGSGSGLLSCPNPTQTSVSLTIRLTDTAGGQVDRVYNFQFAPPPSITTATLLTGEVGAAYDQTMSVSGGVAPFNWSASGLPPGLSLSAAGVISGMPTAVGTYNNITITVNDGPGGTAQKVFNGVVIVPAVRITTPPGPLGPSEVGIAFSTTLTWADGQGPVTFSLASGNLPPGITLAPDGTISGTPASAGGYIPVIRITDALGGTETKVFNLSVNIPPVIVNTSLPKGVVQVPYPPLNLLVQGGVPPYSYSIISGALPSGITFGTTTGQFNGTPTQIESASPTFRVTDSLGGVVSRLIGMQVIDPPLPTDWSRRAQFSGGVGQIILTPGYSNTNAVAFVTADQGGELFRSVDRGFTWQSFLVDPSNSGAPIHTLRLSPDFNYSGSTGAVFASTGAGGVYRSVDGGATFTSRNDGLPNTLSPDGPRTTAIAVSPEYATDTTVWVVALNGNQTQLYMSTTVPESWSLSFTFANIPGASGVTQLEASPNLGADNTLFAIYNGDVYRSTTRGTAWNNVFTDPSPGRKILHLTLNPGYAVTPALCAEDDWRSLFCSKDGGSTWATLGPLGYNITFGRGPSGTALFFKDIGGDYALVMSEDLADTFVPIYARGMRPSSPVFASALAVGAVTGDLYSGTSAGLTVSTDNGNIFFPRQAGLATIKAASVSGAGDFVIAATDGGFLRSRDGGLSFIQIQNLKQADGSVIQLPNLSLAAVSPGYANDKTFFLNVTPNFANTAGLTVTPVNPGLYRTTDGGYTFTSVLQQQCRTMVFAPGFDSRPGQPVRTLYAGCFSGLFRSNDGGVTFLPLATANGMDARCNQSGQTETDGLGLSPRSTGGYTLFRSGSGGICVSTDSGNNWAIMLGGGGAPYIGTISSPASTNANSTTPADRLKLRVDFAVFGIFYSTDEVGTNWTIVRRDAVNPLAGVVYARAFFSPNYATDRLALIAVNRSFNGGTGNAQGGLYRFDANTGIATPLAGADLLRGRVVTGIYMTPNFDGANNTGTALVTTQGGAVYRSTDGAHTFSPITRYDFAAPSIRGMGRANGGALGLADLGKKSPAAPASTVSSGSLVTASDDGVYTSDDGGLTFDDISLGLPEGENVLAVAVPSGEDTTPVSGVADHGLYKFDGSAWIQDATYNAGNFVNFTEDDTYLYAVRADGVSLRGDLTGSNWTTLDNGGTDLQMIAFNNATTLENGPPSAAAFIGPRIPSSTTASLWGISAAAGPKYSINNGSTWTTTTGGNDYTLPSVSTYQTVAALGLDSVSGSRIALAGYNGGLYRTTDGGDTWRSVTITGSGLEATSKNASAVLTSTTAFGTTDVLVGMSGTSVTGGVYLSGDAGEHWTQINSGFDSSTLNITTLVKTSCAGCPVQYYTGTYGSGVYTRTITVSNPPTIPSVNYACWGSTVCACATSAGTGPEEGGQSFKLCGSNFLTLATVEFDGIPATGCTVTGSTVITCTGTPPHFAGGARVRVRNTDTRAGYLPSNYTYTSSSPRVVNSLTVAKSGSNALLGWSCSGCDASHPARIYRSQNAGFTTYNEQYNTTSSSYSNTGAVATAYSYFWNVE